MPLESTLPRPTLEPSKPGIPICPGDRLTFPTITTGHPGPWEVVELQRATNGIEYAELRTYAFDHLLTRYVPVDRLQALPFIRQPTPAIPPSSRLASWIKQCPFFVR